MKKAVVVMLLIVSCSIGHVKQAQAFSLIAIIREAIIRAIKAADLAIQREQNRIIWLQNAQKAIENTMSKLKLDQISDWTEKQRQQYQQYYEELRKVKALISYYQRIREITTKQVRIVKEFERTWALLKNDKHFTAQEIEYMAKVYAGLLEQTIRNIDQMMLVVSSFKTQMSDADRLELINAAADRVDENYNDLHRFNSENILLSLSRSKSQSENQLIKRLYGIK